MNYNSQIHNRHSIRISGFDYSQPGKYFITLNVRSGFKTLNTDHADLLGQIIDGKMILSSIGKIAKKCWLAIPEHYPDAVLHEFIIMPDHIHGIIELTRKSDKEIVNSVDVGIQNFESRQDNQSQITEKVELTSQQLQQIRTINEYQKIIPRSIGCIIRGFKTGVTKLLNESIWQRNYYEHIIRSEASYKRIAQYIINNPANYEYRSNSSSIHKYDSKDSKF